MTSASTSRKRLQFIAQGLTWKGTTRETIWTPQLQTQLDQILTESPQLSFSQIAAKLSLTKGQVIGRVDRMKGTRPQIKRERRRDRDVPYKKAPKEIVPTTLQRLDALNLQFTQFLQETELPPERKYQPKENQR